MVNKKKQQPPKSKRPPARAARLRRPRAKRTLRGSGMYIPTGTLSTLGGEIGSRLGRSAGRFVGTAASHVLGFGDYEVNDLVAKGGPRLHATRPDVALVGAGEKLIISNTELVQMCTSSGSSFTGFQYANNPGLANFPWLSTIAQRFNKYRFKQLLYEFISTSSDYSTTAALGTVAIATNYDPIDRKFQSIQEMESTKNAVSGKPSISKLAGVECMSADDPYKWRFVRSAAQPSNTDVRLYDHSDTTIAWEGLSAASGQAIGRLKVMYTVEFMDPIAIGIPAPFLPAVSTRGWSAAYSGPAGVGPYWGVLDSINSPSLGTTATDVIPFTVQGGSTLAANVSTYAVIDASLGVLNFYANGRYSLAFGWTFSTAPTSATLTATAGSLSIALADPLSGASGVRFFSSTARTMIGGYAEVSVTGASPLAAQTITLAPTGWGSTFVANRAWVHVTYYGAN